VLISEQPCGDQVGGYGRDGRNEMEDASLKTLERRKAPCRAWFG
jgi:hypothetical protein